MWLYYNSFIAEADTKEQKAEVSSRRKLEKRLAKIWETNDKRCSNEAFSRLQM